GIGSSKASETRQAVQESSQKAARDSIAEKVDTAGRHVRQIELCAQHCEIVVECERSRGLEICDRPDEWRSTRNARGLFTCYGIRCPTRQCRYIRDSGRSCHHAK